MRVGVGYDAHRLKDGGPLRLGGVDIEGDCGLEGHSDGDVLLHAVADALLGAMGESDIGAHFPSGDPANRGLDSRKILERVAGFLADRGFEIENIDATVIADAPRLEGHKKAMREAIARLLRVPAGLISVKAKSSEGFCPKGEGIAAQAVVLLNTR